MHTTPDHPDPNRLAQVKAAVLAALAQLPDDLQLWEALLTVLRPWMEAAARPRRSSPRQPGGQAEPGGP